MQLSPLVWKTKQLFLITEKIQKLLPRGNSAHHAFSVLTKNSGGIPTSIPSRRTLQPWAAAGFDVNLGITGAILGMRKGGCAPVADLELANRGGTRNFFR